MVLRRSATASNFRIVPPRLAALLAAGVGAFCFVSTVMAGEPSYRVGPSDKVRIKVSEWRPNSREVFEWTGLSGEFTVNSGGLISLPIVGSVSVDNRTTDEIAALIADRLKVSAGLVNAPAAAVEIAQYRPIYVVGAVEKPGEYAYRPGLNALQAISIAGGFQRAEFALARFERETIVADGEIRLQETQRLALLLRRDRLLAEAQKADAIAFSQALQRYPDAPSAAQGMREETMLFNARRTALLSQLTLLQQARSLLEDELRTLGAKETNQRKQVDLVRRELDNINTLMSKGLAVSPRQLAVEQNLAQLESQSLDLIVAMARAKQEIARTERNSLDLQNQRDADVSRELRETQTSLKQADDRIGSLKLLINKSGTIGPRLETEQSRAASRMSIVLIRREGGLTKQFAAEETSSVQPGDLIKVERPQLQAIAPDLLSLDRRKSDDASVKQN